MSVNEKMTALADAIRSKTGQAGKLSLDAMTAAVNNMEIGAQLPELANEGSAADLLAGKELLGSDGNIVTGTIPTKTASDLTASGATVTVPAGHYATQATKSVASGSAKTPATTITKNPSISVNSSGLITASVSGTQSIAPTVTAGYVSSGTAGMITVSGSATKQLTTQAAKTITPSTSSQTAVASGVYTTGAVTVAPIPDTYIQPSGTLEVSVNGVHDVKNYSSVNVNVASSGDSGGGSVETCTISFIGLDSGGELPVYLYYTKPDLSVGTVSMVPDPDEPNPTPIEVIALKNSIATIVSESACYGGYLLVNVSGNAENALGIAECATILVSGDCTIWATL